MQRRAETLRFVDDQRGSPTVGGHLARTVVDLSLGKHRGIFHVTNQGATTWYELRPSGRRRRRPGPGAGRAHLDRGADHRRGPRLGPANSVLDNAALRLSGWNLLPSWEQAITELVAELIA